MICLNQVVHPCLENRLDGVFCPRFNADVDMDHQLGPRLLLSARTLNTLVVCPLYISAAYHHLECFRLLLRAGAQPDFNYTGPVCQEALTRGLASCLLDAVLRHGCDVAFIHLLLDHGADPTLVPWDESELEAPNRRKVDPEALRVFLEARSEYKYLPSTNPITSRYGEHIMSYFNGC